MLQLSTAPGAHVRVRGQQLEVSSQPALLFDHLTELLQEMLIKHPWYAEPLRIASERARVHLRSSKLCVTGALKIIAMVEDGECFVTIEGVPEPKEVRQEAMQAKPSASDAALDDGTEEEGKKKKGHHRRNSSSSTFDVSMDQLHADVPNVLSGTYCATFTNEINLLDLVADVQDIYRSFTAQVASSKELMKAS